MRTLGDEGGHSGQVRADVANVVARSPRVVVLVPDDPASAASSEPEGAPAVEHLPTPSIDDVQTLVAVGLGGGPDAPQQGWSAEENLERTPLSRSMVGLQRWSTADDPETTPFILVVGDTIQDACLCQCWERAYGPGTAAWLPAAAATSESLQGAVVDVETSKPPTSDALPRSQPVPLALVGPDDVRDRDRDRKTAGQGLAGGCPRSDSNRHCAEFESSGVPDAYFREHPSPVVP